MHLVWIIRGFFKINHGNTHHSDTYMYTHYILASRWLTIYLLCYFRIILNWFRDCKRPDRDRLILSVKIDYFVEIHEKITIEELINNTVIHTCIRITYWRRDDWPFIYFVIFVSMDEKTECRSLYFLVSNYLHSNRGNYTYAYHIVLKRHLDANMICVCVITTITMQIIRY
jgi:hypothetical protein